MICRLYRKLSRLLHRAIVGRELDDAIARNKAAAEKLDRAVKEVLRK